MAGDTLAVVTIKSDTGLAADDWVNNWALTGISGSSEMDLASIAFTDFYEAIMPIYSATVWSDGPGEIAYYDISTSLDGSPHGSPVRTGVLAWAAEFGSDALPSEAAICLTLEAEGRAAALQEVGVTRPKQRRTGRVYLGPLNTATGEVSGGRYRVTAATVDLVLDAAEQLVADIIALGAQLCVWSRTDEVLRPLEAISMDNAFDTIRSRGEDPTLRVRRSV